jgi:hypothetical protein
MFESTTLGYSGITGTGTITGTVVSSNPTFLQGSTDTFLGVNGTNITSVTPKSPENMTSRQVKVAVFTITRDVDTNEITSTKFVKELWVEKKNGTSIDLIVAKQLDADFDPETTVVKELSTISF